MKTPPPQTQAPPNGVAPPQPQAHAQAQQPPPHVNAHARPFQPHHYPQHPQHPQHPYAQHPHDAMGPPRGAPHFEYRPKGDFQDQMNHPEGGADVPPPPFKPGGPLQPHARPYPGQGFIPNNGVPPHFRGPPGPHGYQQRMRGPPRGVPGGMPQQNYPMPRGAMQHPRGYPQYMQQPMHHPGAYGLPPGVPGGPPYMPPPGPMPGYPGVPGPGMGMGMPMNHMPPPHAHTAHAAPPPQQREKKVLTILDPKTGLPITFKAAASTAATATTPAPASTPSTPAKPVESAPSPVVKPQPAVKQPPVMEEAPRATKSPAKKTAKPSNNVNAGDELLAKVKALMEAKKNGTTPVETPAPAATEKKAPVAPVSPKKTPQKAEPVKKVEPVAAPVKKPEPVAAPVKKAEPVAAPVKKAEPVAVAAKKAQPEVVASPKKTPLSPKKAPESPKKAPESPKKAPESHKKAPESPKKTPVAATTPVSSPKKTVAKSPSPKKKVVATGDLINSVGVKENGKFTYSREALRLFRDLYSELPEDAKEGDLKWPTMEIVTESTGRTRGGGRGGRGGRGAEGEAGGPGWDRGSEKPGLNRQSSRSSAGGGGNNWQRSQDLPKRDREERGGRGGRGGGRGGRGGRGQQEPLFDGPVKPLERSDNRWIPVKAESNLEAAKKKVQSIMNKMTREKFDKLAAQIVEINMDSLEMLQGVIKILFDKALGEPHFCDMYADLCVHLESNWKVWSFLKIVQNDDEKKFYWTTMAEADSEVVGPFTNLDDALDASGSDEFEPVQAPQTMKLHEVRIREGKFLKLWVNEQDDVREFFWSGQLLEDIGEEQILNGPYDSHELASRYAIKACSFKRILLNACQEEFEKDNIYEELEEKFKKDKEEGTMSAEAIAEYEEKRIIMKGRMLGNIRFIGELYRKGMLQERIMHECISKLMGVKTGNGAIEPTYPGNAPDEESIESLCKLLGTMGKDLERSNSSAMGMYFAYLEKKLLKDKRLSSRITFMIQDVIEMRGNRWEPRRKELKSKSLDEIRKEAEREAQREQQRPPASAPSGGGRPDAFRMDGRRSNSSRDGGFSQRSTMAPVYSSQSMNSRSGGANKMQLPSRGIQRDDSVKTGPQGRPASFGAGARGQARAPPASAPGPVLGKQNSRGGRGGSGPPTPKHGGAKDAERAAPVVASLSEDDKEAIEKKAKSFAEEYVSIVDLTEADACYAELLKQFKSHAEVPGLVATGILKLAIEAKADVQRAMFDLLEKLSVEKSSLSFEGIRVGIKETIAFGNDLWCDVPKLHENLADFIVRFAKISEKSGVTLDWLMGSCLESIDAEIYDEIIQGGFLAEVCGCTLNSLKTINVEKAKTLVRNTHVTLLSLFPDYKQNAQDFKKWLDKHQIGEALALQPAVDFAEYWTKSKDLDETVKWYQDTVPESVKKDPVFVSLACVLVLGSLKKGALPSDDEGMLFNGLCVSVESQTRLVAALFQTHGAVPDDAAAFKALLTHLVKEQRSIPSLALSKWLELKNDTSVGRKRALAAFGDFVEDLVKKAK